jgi:hypothetical protein
MDIQIIETRTNRLIGTYPIMLGGTLGRVEKDYFDEAWRCAVDDGLVEEGERASYQFKAVR